LFTGAALVPLVADDAFVRRAPRLSPTHVEQGLEGGGADERERIVVVHPPGRAAQERAPQTEGVEARPEPAEITDLQPRSRQRDAEFRWGDEHVPIVGARWDQVQPLLEDLDHEQPRKPGPVDRVEEEEAIRPKHARDGDVT
jgi:hypothetical protein